MNTLRLQRSPKGFNMSSRGRSPRKTMSIVENPTRGSTPSGLIGFSGCFPRVSSVASHGRPLRGRFQRIGFEERTGRRSQTAAARQSFAVAAISDRRKGLSTSGGHRPPLQENA